MGKGKKKSKESITPKTKTKPVLLKSNNSINTRLSSYTPNFTVAFSVLITVRLLSAVYNLVADCDETFNYWEPTHYLMYGYGFQTWEYR